MFTNLYVMWCLGSTVIAHFNSLSWNVETWHRVWHTHLQQYAMADIRKCFNSQHFIEHMYHALWNWYAHWPYRCYRLIRRQNLTHKPICMRFDLLSDFTYSMVYCLPLQVHKTLYFLLFWHCCFLCYLLSLTLVQMNQICRLLNNKLFRPVFNVALINVTPMQ